MSDALINGLAGAGGGIIAQLLTYPLQTVRHAPATYLSLGLPALWLLRVY
jgi:hypothetical protein